MPTKRSDRPKPRRTPTPHPETKATQPTISAPGNEPATHSSDALQESEARYRLLVENAPGVIVLVDQAGRILLANTQVKSMFGYDSTELVGQSLESLLPDRLRDAHISHRARFLKSPSPRHLGKNRDLLGRRKDGSEIPVEVGLSSATINGEPFVQAFIIDITERKRTEQALERSSRAYRTLSESNHMLLRAEDVHSLLKTISEIITTIGGYVGAWVSLIQDDEAHRLPMAVTSGVVADEFLSDAHAMQADFEQGNGLTSLAILTGKPQVIQSINTEEPPFKHRGMEAARRLGYGSVAVFPLTVQAEIIGVLGVIAAETNAFDETETALLTELAGDMSYGIQALHTRALRELAEQALERQNQRLSTLYAVGQVVNSTLDVSEILDFVVDEAMRVTHAERGLALAVDLAAKTFVRRSLRGFTPEEAVRADKMPLRLDQGLNGQAYQTQHMVRVDDVRAQPGYFPLIASTRSELVIPILREDEVLGNIDLQSPEVGAFREVDTHYLGALAEQAALAIFNARLYHELENYNEVLQQAVSERTVELQATKDRVETILSSVGDALLVLRLDGSIEQVNSAFERQTGYSAAEAKLKDHHDLLKLEFGSKGDYQAALEMLTPGQVWQGETKVHRKDHSTYDAALTIAPVRDDVDAIRLLVAIIRDITALKAAERAKDQFVSNVSHELRTPLTSVSLNHELMRNDPEKLDVYLERTEREMRRLRNLIENLLRLSRLDQGQTELDLVLVDLGALVAQFVEDRSLLAENKHLSLTLKPGSRLPLVEADEELIGDALSVLLTNALNYTPPGGRIVISTHMRDEGGRRWAGFSVSDTGPGIPPEELPQLFTRFFRGATGRKSGAPGTGLGLAIAQEIVGRHGGQIEVISDGAPGKGTIFHVWLFATDGPPVD